MQQNNYNNVSTFVRNMYSEGQSKMLISLYKFNLSLLLQPCIGRNPATGKYLYDKKGIMTTIDYNGAEALRSVSSSIIEKNDEAYGVLLSIPCANGVLLKLETLQSPDGEIDTVFSLTNMMVSIPFTFETRIAKEVRNGKEADVIIQAGLGAFTKTLEGYLLETGASSHLNKLGDDLEQIQHEWQVEKEQQEFNHANANS